MRLPLFRLLKTIRSSYWFLPSVMAVAALLVGIGAVWFDTVTGNDWLDQLSWAQKSKPDAAREMLSAIASSMITVAGVVFSITIVAIGYAAGQYGPRVLTNFMSDRGNQLTLGTFIATFVYSLIVMRTIHTGDSEFVPQFSVMLAIALALCSIAVLIYFIHHVPSSIHVNSVISRIGRDLLRQIERHASRAKAKPIDPNRTEPLPDRSKAATAVPSTAIGYVQAIDETQLVDIACKHDLVIEILSGAGQFVSNGGSLARLWPCDSDSDEISSSIRSCFALGNSRTPAEDLTFLVDELVEIAARALSTGVNDPYTAITCIDWMGAALIRLAHCPPRSEERRDDDGTVRLLADVPSFDTVLDRAFDRVRPYVARDPNATDHSLCTLRAVANACQSAEQLLAVKKLANSLVSAAEERQQELDLDRVKSRKRDFDKRVRDRAKELQPSG